MYNTPPVFIFGFHGCDISVKERILKTNKMEPSQNEYDWLGHGFYFWEQNYERAYEFACEAKQRSKISRGVIYEPAVVGAVINLGNCLNLLSSSDLKKVDMSYRMLANAAKSGGYTLPTNSLGKDKVLRKLDCAVIESIHAGLKDKKEEKYDTVRAMFPEGTELYEGAGFKNKSHIQVCVRNMNCIKAFFDPKEKMSNCWAW